jgi:protein-tyrosine-phosphatase
LTDGRGRNRVLFVCTANICRSATAELLARQRFGEEANIFRSAGFLEPGHAVPGDLVKVLADRGIDASAHRSYQLDEASVAAADVLLTMESSHIQRITSISPEALAKSVPLKEAAQLMERLEPGPVTVERLLAELNRDRDPLTYLGARWDVDDPFGRRAKAYRRAVDEIAALVDVVIGRLG